MSRGEAGDVVEEGRSPAERLPMRHLGRIVRHTSVYGLYPILARAVGLLMLPLYTNFLSPADYGSLEVIILAGTFLNIFLGIEAIQGMIRLYHVYEAERDRREVVSTGIMFTGVVTTAGVIVADTFRHQIAIGLFGNHAGAYLLRLTFWSLITTNILGMGMGYLQTRRMSGVFTTLSVIQLAATLALNVLCVAVFGRGVEGILLSQLIVTGTFAAGLTAWVLCQVGCSVSWAKARELLAFGIPLIGMSLGWFVMNAADRAVLSSVGSLSDVGLYSLANRLATPLLVFLVTPFSMLWATERFELAKHEGGGEIIARVFTYFFVGLCFVGLGLSVWMDEMIRLMTAQQFWVAAGIGPVLVLAYGLWGVFGYLTTGLLIARKTICLGFLNACAAVLNVLLSVVLGPVFLARGVAVARVLALGILILGIYALAQRAYPINFEFSRIAKVAGITVGLFVASKYFDGHPPFLGMGIKAPFVFGFPILLVCVGFLNAGEKRWIASHAKAVIGKLQLVVGVQ